MYAAYSMRHTVRPSNNKCQKSPFLKSYGIESWNHIPTSTWLFILWEDRLPTGWLTRKHFSLACSPVEITDKIRSDDDTYIMIVYFITVKWFVFRRFDFCKVWQIIRILIFSWLKSLRFFSIFQHSWKISNWNFGRKNFKNQSDSNLGIRKV